MADHPLSSLAARVGCDVDELLVRIAGSEDVCNYIADRLTRKALAPDGKTHLLSPPNPISPLACRLEMHRAAVTARYPEPHDGMKAVVKDLGWWWDWPTRAWTLEINNRNGPALDRLVEAGCALLARGFIINAPNEEIARRIEADDYTPRQHRWVMQATSGKYAGWFCIEWGRKDDLYAPAVRIHGARYSPPHVVAPPEAYDEVLDFAEEYDFSLSEGALKVAEQARRQAGEIAVIQPPALHKRERLRDRGRAKPAKIPELTEPVGVADELLDTDD